MSDLIKDESASPCPGSVGSPASEPVVHGSRRMAGDENAHYQESEAAEDAEEAMDLAALYDQYPLGCLPNELVRLKKKKKDKGKEKAGEPTPKSKQRGSILLHRRVLGVISDRNSTVPTTAAPERPRTVVLSQPFAPSPLKDGSTVSPVPSSELPPEDQSSKATEEEVAGTLTDHAPAAVSSLPYLIKSEAGSPRAKGAGARTMRKMSSLLRLSSEDLKMPTKRDSAATQFGKPPEPRNVRPFSATIPWGPIAPRRLSRKTQSFSAQSPSPPGPPPALALPPLPGFDMSLMPTGSKSPSPPPLPSLPSPAPPSLLSLRFNLPTASPSGAPFSSLFPSPPSTRQRSGNGSPQLTTQRSKRGSKTSHPHLPTPRICIEPWAEGETEQSSLGARSPKMMIDPMTRDEFVAGEVETRQDELENEQISPSPSISSTSSTVTAITMDSYLGALSARMIDYGAPPANSSRPAVAAPSAVAPSSGPDPASVSHESNMSSLPSSPRGFALSTPTSPHETPTKVTSTPTTSSEGNSQMSAHNKTRRGSPPGKTASPRSTPVKQIASSASCQVAPVKNASPRSALAVSVPGRRRSSPTKPPPISAIQHTRSRSRSGSLPSTVSASSSLSSLRRTTTNSSGASGTLTPPRGLGHGTAVHPVNAAADRAARSVGKGRNPGAEGRGIVPLAFWVTGRKLVSRGGRGHGIA